MKCPVPGAQVVEHEHLVRLGHAQLPGQARALDARPRARARAAVVPRDHDVLGLALCALNTYKLLPISTYSLTVLYTMLLITIP